MKRKGREGGREGEGKGKGRDGHSTWFQLNTDFIIQFLEGVGAVVVAALKHITFYEVKIKY